MTIQRRNFPVFAAGVTAIALSIALFAAPVGAAAGLAGKPAGRIDRHDYAARADVREFIGELVHDDGFSRKDLVRWFRAARYQPKIVAAMQRPLLEPPKWFEYAPRFLTPERIAGGAGFWRAHDAALARAEETFGVPPEIVIAILGVETFYGRNTGSYRVIDALTTLAFDYPRRGAYFRGQLREFLIASRRDHFSPLEAKGSFAGAMGVPQFMPGSMARYAVDFDGDGRVDLWTSDDDVIGSVANYLARHDWLRGQPLWSPAFVVESKRDAALSRLDGGISERRPLAAWNADGVAAAQMPEPMAPEPVGLLLLEDGPDAGMESLWVVFPNFYVITRYNKSRLYAAAVTSLAQAIRAVHQATP